MSQPDSPDLYHAGFATRVGAVIDAHREMLAGSLAGLSEDEARRHLVPSRTTLLGLVEHATFVERVWFAEAVTGARGGQLGLPADPD